MDRDLSAQVFLLTQKHVAHGIGVYAQQKRAPAPAIGGLQLLAIGIVGEYIGKIYLETKARPKYIIETVLDK